jgi:two-component system cell cycle sensor histidine kinase/response regulator CckA
LDVRTPIITATQKLLGYDGVFVDITRQAIAEHRLSSSVWREGLATLTNGLVHDFSNLMSGIYSISELYHGMMEKDDPMAKGMGQIKKSAMQAQKLVRRIIDLHRDKAASRTIHDLRLLLKDQMDLVDIIIPRSAKIVTDFGTAPMPAFIEETGFRQVILNLVINARDAIERNGKIKITLKCVKKGQRIMIGARGEQRIAPTQGAELTLIDNGKGIPSAIEEKLFDPFFTTKSSGSGSGFGLYNTKVFMEDHNGLIGFSSKVGKGTTFFLFLPWSQMKKIATPTKRDEQSELLEHLLKQEKVEKSINQASVL